VELRPDDLKSGILEATKARLHGTTVASLAAGTTNGVAPAAQVKVWRVVHVDVQADEPIALWAAAAFGKIVEANKAESHLHVINCSFGALSPNNLTAPTLLFIKECGREGHHGGIPRRCRCGKQRSRNSLSES
jgi:hypothetical protein